MTVFDVYVNDKKACRAGVGRDGVLSAIINWVKLTGPAVHFAHGHGQPGEGARLHVGGLRNNTHLSWIERQLEVGDRISVVVAKGRAVDPPVRRKIRNPAQEKRQQRDYYQRLKEHFEPAGSETRFLNVDLDLWSASPLDPLLNALGRRVIVLHAGKDGRQYRAHLELASEGIDPDRVVRRFVGLVEQLPRPARVAWNRARVREFNVGIQSGEKPHGFECKLKAATVQAVARVDARIGVTVYGASGRI